MGHIGKTIIAGGLFVGLGAAAAVGSQLLVQEFEKSRGCVRNTNIGNAQLGVLQKYHAFDSLFKPCSYGYKPR